MTDENVIADMDMDEKSDLHLDLMDFGRQLSLMIDKLSTYGFPDSDESFIQCCLSSAFRAVDNLDDEVCKVSDEVGYLI
ncbi:MAG: hypothetical protein IJT54_05895 [Candidatus Methanomethylophilaceae archaeon]|nr:hypothetical protein [Candidatus Methanomethylophilaceae archaeon]